MLYVFLVFSSFPLSPFLLIYVCKVIKIVSNCIHSFFFLTNILWMYQILFPFDFYVCFNVHILHASPNSLAPTVPSHFWLLSVPAAALVGLWKPTSRMLTVSGSPHHFQTWWSTPSMQSVASILSEERARNRTQKFREFNSLRGKLWLGVNRLIKVKG